MDTKRISELLDRIMELVHEMEALLKEADLIEKASDKRYIVKAGDTLWSIAEAHYGPGHGGQYPLIFEANQPPLTDPDVIKPGQALKIPPLVGRAKD